MLCRCPNTFVAAFFLIPSLVSKKASKKTSVPILASLPFNWPSRLHNKCSSPNCHYPNSPQVVAGLYNCRGGSRHGYVCEGTYVVTPASADQTMRNFHASVAREEEVKRTAKLKAEAQIARSRQQEAAIRQASAEVARAEAERRQARGGQAPAARSQQQPLERRAAQRKRQDIDQTAPASPTYRRRRPQPSFEQVHYTHSPTQHIPIQVAPPAYQHATTLPPSRAQYSSQRSNVHRLPVPPAGMHSYENYSRRQVRFISHIHTAC